MIDPTQVFSYTASGLWPLFAFFALVALQPPIREVRQHSADPEKKRRALRWLSARFLLLLLLFPPFVWAITVGRWGATIRLRQRELVGTSYFGRFLGRVDLDGVSLRLEHRRHARGSAWVLVGAKKWEELRIDGYVDQQGKSLTDVVRQEYRVPVVEVR